MADEDENIKKEITYNESEEEEEEEEEESIARPESPRTTAARYLLDLANNFESSMIKSIAHNAQQHHQATQPYDLNALSVNTWGHDKSQSYIEECGLPFTSDQMLMACRTLNDLNHFLSDYKLTKEQTALCYAAYQMGRGNNLSSNSPGTEATSLETIAGWNYHLIHVLDHSYASMKAMQMESDMGILNRKSSTTEDISYSSDGGASSTGSNVMENELSRSSRKTSWDERNYRRLGLPYTYEEIVDSPMDEFNELMNNGNLTEEQVILCRNTRRRGKNKVAAQNCRRRKLGLISKLKTELDVARRTRQQLMEERQRLQQECIEWQTRLMDVKQLVLDGLGKDPHAYSIEVMDENDEPWDASVVVKKKCELNDIRILHPQVSIMPPMNGITGDYFNQMLMNSKEVTSLDDGDEKAIKDDHENEEEPSYQEPEIMIKEEILEIESPSHI